MKMQERLQPVPHLMLWLTTGCAWKVRVQHVSERLLGLAVTRCGQVCNKHSVGLCFETSSLSYLTALTTYQEQWHVALQVCCLCCNATSCLWWENCWKLCMHFPVPNLFTWHPCKLALASSHDDRSYRFGASVTIDFVIIFWQSASIATDILVMTWGGHTGPNFKAPDPFRIQKHTYNAAIPKP